MYYDTVILVSAGTIGIIVGFLTGIFGVGGGFLMTPVLMIVLGVPGHIAVGTSLVVSFVNSSFGIIHRRGSKTIDLKLALIISAGSVIGVLLGSQIINVMKDVPKFTFLGKQQEPLQYFLLLLFLMLLTWVAVHLSYDYRNNGGKAPDKRIGVFERFKIPPFMYFTSLEQPYLSVLPLLFLGFCVGVLTGLMGIGGGVVLLPALVYLVGQRTFRAAGTSLLLIWISSLVAVIRKGIEGQISLHLCIALLIGGIIGTAIGTKIGLRLSGPKIRIYFVYVVVAAVLLIAYKLFLLTF